MAELVETIWPEDGGAIVEADGVANLKRLLHRAAGDASLAVAARGMEGLRRAGDRTWLAAAIRRARVSLPESTLHMDDTATPREELLVTIARADARRGAALLRDILRRERGEPGGIADDVLLSLCDTTGGVPIPDCRPSLQRMFDARARLLRDDPT